MFTISKLSNVTAALCALMTSALFIVMSVGPAETTGIGMLFV